MTRGRFVLSGHHFENHSPTELAAMIGRVGADGLDAWPWNLGGAPEVAARQLGDLGVPIVAINVPGAVARLGDPAGPTAVVEAATKAIELAGRLGADMVQLYAASPAVTSPIQAAEELAWALAPILPTAQREGVVVSIENNLDQRDEDPRAVNPTRYAATLGLAMDLLASPSVGVAFDPCNFTVVGEEPFPHAYELLRHHIVNVHIKDCTRYSPKRHGENPGRGKLLVDSHMGGYLPVPVGQGSVPWMQISERLRADGYGGWLTLDPFVVRGELEHWCRDSAAWVHEHLTKDDA